MHLIGYDTIFYNFAITENLKKRWCGVFFIVDNEFVPVNKFEVKESEISYRPPFAFMLVLDHSGSMGTDRAYEIQEAV